MKGKIVLVHFPFTDLSAVKLRPALVLYESDDDVIVAFISSRIPSSLLDSDLPVMADSDEFPATGLKVSSVIKFDKIATLSKVLVEGEIGEISPVLAARCNDIMDSIFHF